MAGATVAIPSMVQPFRTDSLRAGRLRKLHSLVSLEMLFSRLRSSDFVSLYTCHSGHSYLRARRLEPRSIEHRPTEQRGDAHKQFTSDMPEVIQLNGLLRQ